MSFTLHLIPKSSDNTIKKGLSYMIVVHIVDFIDSFKFRIILTMQCEMRYIRPQVVSRPTNKDERHCDELI